MMINSEQFYQLWERFSVSEIMTELPNDVEEFCKDAEITVDYFLMEFV